MQVKDWQDLLGKEIPNALNAFKALELKAIPLMAELEKNRDKVDPSLLVEYDKAMQEIKNAKLKYGNFSNK